MKKAQLSIYLDPETFRSLEAFAKRQGTIWTSQVRKHLEGLDTPYVLLCLEDFFFRDRVSTPAVQECLAVLDRLSGHTMRLICRPGPDLRIAGQPKFGIITPGAPFRVSTQAAIWNRRSLLSLMKEGESIWQFEVLGSERSANYTEGFYGVRGDVFTYKCHVVEKGKWFPWAARRWRAANIGCDFHSRSIMTANEAVRWCIFRLRSYIFEWIPWPTRLRLFRFLKALASGIVSERAR